MNTPTHNENLNLARENVAEIQATLNSIKPNHILHIILSFLTGGVWLIVYAFVGITSSIQKPELERSLLIAKGCQADWENYQSAQFAADIMADRE